MTKLDKKQLFIQVFIETRGHVSESCTRVGISRQTFYNWKNQPKFAREFEEAVEKHNDTVAQKILDLAISGDKEMLKFWADRQMKHRGFGDSKKLEHMGEYPVKIIIEDPDGDGDTIQADEEAAPSS